MEDKMELTKEKAIEYLKNNICEVTFKKVDGTDRIMKCTLKQCMLPIRDDTLSAGIEKKHREAPDYQVAVWDLDKKAWRSFNLPVVKFNVVVFECENCSKCASIK